MRMRKLDAAGPAVSALGLECMAMIPLYGAKSPDDFAPIDFTPTGERYAPAMMGLHNG